MFNQLDTAFSVQGPKLWNSLPAFFSGTGLRSRNYQTCPTRFRISELGNQVQISRHFR